MSAIKSKLKVGGEAIFEFANWNVNKKEKKESWYKMMKNI